MGKLQAHELHQEQLNQSFFLHFKEKVLDLFYSTRIASNPDAVYKKIFDLKFKDMQDRWRNYLKRKYFPFIKDHDVPYEVYERKTNHKNDNSNMNFAYMNLNEKLSIIKKDLPKDVRNSLRIRKYVPREFSKTTNLLTYKIYGDMKLYEVYQYAEDNIKNSI